MGAGNFNTEQDLLRQVAASDERAYASLYHTYYPVVFSLSLKMVKIHSAAQDVCNEVFLAIWQNRQRLMEVQSLRAYLQTAARNQSLNMLKSMTRSALAKAEIAKSFPGTSLSSEDRIQEKEYTDFIHRGVEQLPPRAKQVFTLCRQQGYSYEDVSAELGISRNAVKSHMVYSIKKLRSQVAKDFGLTWVIACLFSQF